MTCGSARVFSLAVLVVTLLSPMIVAAESSLEPDTALGNGALVWKALSGQSVHLDPPELHVDGRGGATLTLAKQIFEGKTAKLTYIFSLATPEAKVDGAYDTRIELDGDEGLRQTSGLVFRSRSNTTFASRRHFESPERPRRWLRKRRESAPTSRKFTPSRG